MCLRELLEPHLPLRRARFARGRPVLLRRAVRVWTLVPVPGELRLLHDLERTALAMEAGTHSSVAAVRRALERDRGELVQFVRRRAAHLVDPDEVVQRAALRAIERATQLRDPSRARAWLFRLTRNALADELRAIGARVHDVPSTDVEDTAEVGTDGAPCGCALTLSRELKPEYAEILTRVVIDETPIVRIAGELGLTANNATVRLHRARQALRRRMAERCGTTSAVACASCACDERGCSALV